MSPPTGWQTEPGWEHRVPLRPHERYWARGSSPGWRVHRITTHHAKPYVGTACYRTATLNPEAGAETFTNLEDIPLDCSHRLCPKCIITDSTIE